jgi:hypothetical protein
LGADKVSQVSEDAEEDAEEDADGASEDAEENAQNSDLSNDEVRSAALGHRPPMPARTHTIPDTIRPKHARTDAHTAPSSTRMASKSTQDEDDSEEVEEQEQEQEDEEHDEAEQEQEQAESDADSDVAEALGFSLHAFLGRALTEAEARVLSESRAPGGDRSKLHPLAIDGLPPLLSDTTELAELRPDADADAFAGIKDSVRALWDESYGTPTEQQAAIFTLMQRHVDMLMPVCTGENEDGLLPVRATATRQRSAPYRHRHHPV